MKNTIRVSLFVVIFIFFVFSGILSFSVYLLGSAGGLWLPLTLSGAGTVPAEAFMVPLLCLFCMLGFLAFIALYLRKKVFLPVRRLTLSVEEIVNGSQDEEILLSRERNEIGTLARSLYHLTEQLRMYSYINERTGRLLDIYTRLNRSLYKNNNIEDACNEVITVLRECFNASRVYLVVMKDGTAQILSSYAGQTEREPASPRPVHARLAGEIFFYHDQVAGLVRDKRVFLCNSIYENQEQKFKFIDEDVTNFCILPFERDETLLGYIVMEGTEERRLHINDDSELLFISETIGAMVSRTPPSPEKSGSGESSHSQDFAAGTPEIPKENTAAIILRAAAKISGLDTENGLFLAGGSEKDYAELLRVSARIFTETAEQMRGQYREQLHDFGITVHGVKGALYSIGAQTLGDRALKLENAAGKGDANFCAGEYPVFESELLAIAERIEKACRETGARKKKPGNTAELADALESAAEALASYNIIQASELLSPFTEQSWTASVSSGLELVCAAIGDVEYDRALSGIKTLCAIIAEEAEEETRA
jgi:HPt (histidine-containing phosphotransfer) domain-containing protein